MKFEKSNQTLTTNEALILQQVYEDGGGELSTLARENGLSKKYILELVNKLKRRGLIYLENDYEGISVYVTRAGQRLIRYIWPESQMARV